MKASFIRAIPIAALILFSPLLANGAGPSLVVVEKDGTTVETPIPDVSRVDFDTFSFSVQTKDGGSEKYDYDKVSRIHIGSYSGITLPSKDVPLAVWPTVTSSTLYVSGTEAKDMIQVFSINGTLEITTKPVDGVNQIDVSGLAAGHYVLKAGDTSVRFIKK